MADNYNSSSAEDLWSPWPATTDSPTVSTLPPVHTDMPLVRRICEVYISLPLAILGIVGNVLAFIVLCRQKQRLTTNVLLQALAVADTCVLVSSILLRSLRYVGWDSYLAIYDYIFLGLYPCVYFFRLADTWITVIMTIDRYIAVCHPLHAQRLCTMRRTYVALAVIVALTLAVSLPRFFEYRLGVEGTRQGFKHTDLVNNQHYTLIYRITLFFLVMYLIPMVVLIVLNVFLVRVLRRAYTTRSQMIQDGSMHRANGLRLSKTDSRSVTVVVSIIVTVCVVCNVTAMATHVLWSIQMGYQSLAYLSNIRRYLANVSNVMVTFNCAVNFIIYCLFSRKFRTGFSQTFRCDWETEASHPKRLSNSSESATAANTLMTSHGALQPLRTSRRSANGLGYSSVYKLPTGNYPTGHLPK